MNKLAPQQETNFFDRSIKPARPAWIAWLLPIILLLIVFGPGTRRYFLGKDDFIEIGRAHFIDSRDPVQVWTTPHDGYKYRPLDRLTTLLTYLAAGENPAAYRVRNVFLHMINALIFGITITRLTRDRRSGVIATLLFGLAPASSLTVSLAVTTKPFLGLFFLLTALLWLDIWETRRVSILKAVTAAILSVITILYHEQALLIITAFPLAVATGLFIRHKRKREALCCLGIALGILATVFLLRSNAQTGNQAIELLTWSGIGRNILYVGAGLLAPLDFLLIFGPDAVTRSGVQLLDGNLAAVRLGFFGILSAGFWGILGMALISRFKRRKGLWILAGLACGLLLSLAPAVLFVRYSELYGYLPVLFLVAIFVSLLLPGDDDRIKKEHRKAYLGCLVFLLLSYTSSAIYRQALLWEGTGQARAIMEALPELVPDPQAGSRFVFTNLPAQRQGYSLYGLTGVQVLEDQTGVTAALKLVYDRPDLSGTILEDPDQFAAACQKQTEAEYFLYWHADQLTLTDPDTCLP